MLKTLLRSSLVRHCSFPSRLLHEAKTKLDVKDVKEIKIPMPWGHIAGKWWGPQDVTPLIGLHGWQDNANTFDRLAPLLPAEVSLLALDSPGHGLSSHFQRGVPYRTTDQIFVLRRIVQHFGWNKISLLGHSLGAVQSFIYSAVYPDQVENLIFIDAFKPTSVDMDKDLEKIPEEIDKYLAMENLNDSCKPVYSYEEAVNKLYEGMIGQSLTKESCEVLLQRGAQVNENGYVYTRDSLLKVARLRGWLHHYVVHMASQISCNVLLIKAVPGLVFESLKVNKDALDAMRKSAKAFQFQTVEGLHHVHLNNPQRVAPIINNFLKSPQRGSSEISIASLEQMSRKEIINFT